ncbi:aldolase/citrate lyase family protein [Dactylosporangium sp. NPDC051484]|uniref:HpcH/HpaI aldolase family protein n=1 Tax=Dactylosporangium sp. NPDC051484 TaxID=3154942 RepID=UPI00344D517A
MMMDGHLNGAIRALEEGRPVLASFSPADPGNAQAFANGPYDVVVFEMEHNPYSTAGLRNSLQYLLDRKAILERGDPSPTVTPFVRVPANGCEMNQFLAKQALDAGVYGIIFPHVSTVEEARNAVASCRYPRPPSAPRYEPAGVRGDGPFGAARYWGIDVMDYYRRADTWPLAPDGDIFVVIMCEEVKAIRNLPAMLAEVQGIGAVLIGEGDLSQDLGHPRAYQHPEVEAAIADVLAICADAGVPAGIPHVTPANVEKRLEQGFQWLMPNPVRTNQAVDIAKAWLAKRKEDTP